jgi:hypothetical protein
VGGFGSESGNLPFDGRFDVVFGAIIIIIIIAAARGIMDGFDVVEFLGVLAPCKYIHTGFLKRKTYLRKQDPDLPRRFGLLVPGTSDPDAGIARLEVGVLGQHFGLLMGGLPFASVSGL